MAREAVKLALIRRDNRRTCKFRTQRFQKEAGKIGNEAATYCLIVGAASSILHCLSIGSTDNERSQSRIFNNFVRRKRPVSEKIVHTSDGSFDSDVLQSDKPVLLDFWAEWCSPCKMIAPLLNEAADEYADRLAVVKLNIDDNPNTPQKFGIRSIPTLMLFKDGAVQAQKLGAMSKSQLIDFLDSNL